MLYEVQQELNVFLAAKKAKLDPKRSVDVIWEAAEAWAIEGGLGWRRKKSQAGLTYWRH